MRILDLVVDIVEWDVGTIPVAGAALADEPLEAYADDARSAGVELG